MEFKRCSGILMPISSLPGGYGIGSMGKPAHDFVDFLAKAGQTIWQILPVGPTGYADSPYQSCSAFAGNPYFIDLDLLAADAAAAAEYPLPGVVFDFGTATTLDAVSREGVYLGGCITAGVQVSIDGLFQKTALLPRVELVKPDTVLSTTAVGQIQAGAVLGYIGAIEYLIRHAKEEIGQPDTKVVATGGLSRLVADNTELIDVVDPQLVLDGLRIIYERARR